jgi:hypothetical protein
MANAIERVDQQLSLLLADWGVLTTLLALVIAAFVAYPILYPSEPDTHPLLLARQSSVSPVRSKNESALYRSPEVPHGYPLKTGLNVKDEGAARWSPGKNGDMRDIWRVVRRGGENGEKGLIMTVLGKEEIIEHDIEELSKEIEIIGMHLKAKGVKSVAIYLPNSIEFLLAISGESKSNFVLMQECNANEISMLILRAYSNSPPVQPTTTQDIRTSGIYFCG